MDDFLTENAHYICMGRNMGLFVSVSLFQLLMSGELIIVNN
jgi:hypothetical protein